MSKALASNPSESDSAVDTERSVMTHGSRFTRGAPTKTLGVERPFVKLFHPGSVPVRGPCSVLRDRWLENFRRNLIEVGVGNLAFQRRSKKIGGRKNFEQASLIRSVRGEVVDYQPYR
jgi:hypothetical protein